MLVTLGGIVTLVSKVQFWNTFVSMLVTPCGIASEPLGAELYPMIVILAPELLTNKLRLLGIHTPYRFTSAFPIAKVAPAAKLDPGPVVLVVQPANV